MSLTADYELTSQFELSPLLQQLLREKKAANNMQKKKHDDWDDNYQLYRGKVLTNRLTQRQSVNIPLMKETIKTMLSKIDDAPHVEWKEKSGDESKQLIYQEVWNNNSKNGKFELYDIIDKKNVLLYGIGTRKLNLVEDGISCDILDPYDVVFDPLMKVSDIETSRFIVHQNIMRSVREIVADERYTKEGKDEVKKWIDSPPGIQQGGINKKIWEEKMNRLLAMDITSKDFVSFAGGDKIINLTEHYTNIWDTKGKKFERRVVVYADDHIELMNEKLSDLIGVEFWPFVVWTEDPETADLYSDPIADLVRVPNKILNIWFSQLVENRTLKNFQMHWFLPVQGFTPQQYQPGPGVLLPAPAGDDINKVIKPIDIQGLDETFTDISLMMNIVERGVGTGAIMTPTAGGKQKKQTATEQKKTIQLAQERTIHMTKFYRLAWYEFAWKWGEMIHANAPKILKLTKFGRSGKAYPKKVLASDWKSTAGYEPIVRSTSEQEEETAKGIQKFSFLLQQFPTNPALKKIAQKRMLEMVDLTPEELKQVEDAENQAEQQATQAQQGFPQQQKPQQMPQMASAPAMGQVV